MEKTIFFRSCLGVFQGGGCRAAALVGAYEEAINRGVQFIEVAGTSAGSIIAVLVGAGATPKQLSRFVEDLDFKTLLKPPEITKSPNFLTRAAAKPFGRLSDLLFHQGFHSSVGIEIWVENCLRELLGKHQGPIPFSMLHFPTSVVATDILSRRPRVWNQRVSPNESVAKAVRASCSIPIFFQPMNQQYVDGGALSNLPSFVFANGASDKPLTSRILAFTLKGDDEQLAVWETQTYLSAVANTVVEGAQDLQMNLQGNVHAINIPTGKIKATDFHKIDAACVATLMDAGKKAAADFFRAELTHVKAPRMPSEICYDKEDLYNSITSHLSAKVDDVIISEFDTDFVYSLFPSLLLWKMRGVRLRVLLTKNEAREAGEYRRRLLNRLGVEVVEMESLPFRGYLINCHEANRGSAFVALPPGTGKNKIEAVVYDGAIHSIAITSLFERLTSFFAKDAPAKVFIPRIVEDSQNELFAKLRNVNQYNKVGVVLSLETIHVADLVALANFVHEYKYRQVQHWVDEYRKLKLRPFECAKVELLDAAKSIITPPVVEETDGKFVLLEGSTRAVYLRDQGVERIVCVVVRGIQDPLPGRPTAFSNVRVVGRRLDTDFRYENFNYTLFRKIELAVHPLNSFQ